MINLTHKLSELDAELISLLESLDAEDWGKPTIAKLWTVKDIAAHLLDGNIRILSGWRDGYEYNPPNIANYDELLAYLNGLNAEWVQAMKRVSPTMLIELLKMTGPPYCTYYASLDLFGPSKFSVAWAGEEESKNWMHIAREYTEKFLHQQQIRDATNRPGIMTEEYFKPFLDVCMYALPHTLRNTPAQVDESIQMIITGEVSGSWWVRYDGSKWNLVQANEHFNIVTEVSIPYEISWKLFSKGCRPKDVMDQVGISGNVEWGQKALEMVSFMV